MNSVIFYFRILWSRHTVKTLSLKVSLCESFDLVIMGQCNESYTLPFNVDGKRELFINVMFMHVLNAR